MVSHQSDPTSELRAEIDRFVAAANGLQQPRSNSTITISGGSLAAIVATGIGAVAVICSVCAVVVVSAWRDADMKDVAQLRHEMEALSRRVEIAEAYQQQQAKRLTLIEARQQP